MNKKRGAPLGNKNAYKHGFYSAAFKAAEERMLSELPAHDLTAEIELIRVGTLRLLLALDSAGNPADIATQMISLRILNLSAHSITSLMRTQAWALSAREAVADLDRVLGTSVSRSSATAAPTPPADDRDPRAR